MLALPSEKAAEIALRTQQVIDGGDRRGQRRRPARRLLVRRGAHRPDRGRGGGDLRPDPRARGAPPARRHPSHRPDHLRASCAGSRTAGSPEIADAAFEYQRALEKGDKRVVGVNVHTDAIESPTGDPARVARGRAGAGRPARRAPCGTRRRSRREGPRRAGRGLPDRRPTSSRCCSTPRGPRRRSARCATCCAPSGAPTASRSDRPHRAPLMGGAVRVSPARCCPPLARGPARTAPRASTAGRGPGSGPGSGRPPP